MCYTVCFCLTGSARDDLLLAVECMDKLIRKRRQISLQRVLAFVKRLSTICLQLLPGACLAVMATVRAFMQVYNPSLETCENWCMAFLVYHVCTCITLPYCKRVLILANFSDFVIIAKFRPRYNNIIMSAL